MTRERLATAISQLADKARAIGLYSLGLALDVCADLADGYDDEEYYTCDQCGRRVLLEEVRPLRSSSGETVECEACLLASGYSALD